MAYFKSSKYGILFTGEIGMGRVSMNIGLNVRMILNAFVQLINFGCLVDGANGTTAAWSNSAREVNN